MNDHYAEYDARSRKEVITLISRQAKRIAELEAIERRAIDALRGNASETDEYERGWLDACAEILGKRPR